MRAHHKFFEKFLSARPINNKKKVQLQLAGNRVILLGQVFEAAKQSARNNPVFELEANSADTTSLSSLTLSLY